jgi:hypothetical protein
MGKGDYHGGSTGGTFDEDGTPRFKEGLEAPLNKGVFKNRWSENTTVDQDARLAAKQYRKLVSRFLALGAVAFRKDSLSASLPAPPKELKPEISAWGGNIAWIDKHDRRKYQFAESGTSLRTSEAKRPRRRGTSLATLPR